MLVASSGLFAQSRGRYFLKSLCVPGWGQFSQDSNSGWYFAASEISAWASLLYFQRSENQLTDKSKNYAVQYAGLAHTHYDDVYYGCIARYLSSGFSGEGYGEYLLRKAQADNPAATPADISIDVDPWEWQSGDHKREYKIYRKDAAISADYATAMVGIIVGNHLLSGLHAAWLYGRNQRLHTSMKLYNYHTPMLTCKWEF